MAANTAPVFERAPFVKAVEYTTDAANTKKTVVASADVPTEGLRIDQLSVVSTDTATKEFRVYQTIGGTDYLVLTYTVPAAAGTGTTALLDLIQFLAPTLGYITVPTGQELKVENVATLTAAKQVDIIARGGSFSAS